MGHHRIYQEKQREREGEREKKNVELTGCRDFAVRTEAHTSTRARCVHTPFVRLAHDKREHILPLAYVGQQPYQRVIIFRAASTKTLNHSGNS